MALKNRMEILPGISAFDFSKALAPDPAEKALSAGLVFDVLYDSVGLINPGFVIDFGQTVFLLDLLAKCRNLL